MLAIKRSLFAFIAATLVLATASLAHAGSLRIAVAANFTDTTRDLIALFEESSDTQVSASFGSSGKLYAQIENGAPFDVFQAADSQRPQMLEENGSAVAGSRFTYAQGKLALWSPQADVFNDPIDWLSNADFRRLAIANPKTAPYGLAAQQVLTELALWEILKPRLVRGDSIAQTFQFTATTNAQAGFVALSQVNAWSGDKGTLWIVPQEMYQPIAQQAVVLNYGKDNPAAHEWVAFLRSPDAVRIITDSGYEIAH